MTECNVLKLRIAVINIHARNSNLLLHLPRILHRSHAYDAQEKSRSICLNENKEKLTHEKIVTRTWFLVTW